jgi:hypothetical protein
MSAVNYPPLNASPGGQKLFVLSVVFEVLSIFTIILRLISRSLKSKSLVFNDYAAMVALALSSGNNSVCWIGKLLQFLIALFHFDIFKGVYWAGIGHHVVDVNPEYRWRVLMCFFVAQPMWAAANTAVKFSILHLYITAFPSMLLRRICYITMAISAAYFIHVILESMLLCKPVRYSWDKTIPGSCSPYSITAYVVSGTINISIDILILILPMPKLWTLNFSWQKKVAIMSMFSLGAV